MKIRFYSSLAAVPLALSAASLQASEDLLTVYKSPSCGCCGAWIEHMDDNGFKIDSKHPMDLNAVKKHFGVTPENQSCHTAVSKEGYVFEGHVPAKYVEQFLQAPPEGAIGLSVPEMPIGTPGMEMGERFQPYEVVQMNKDGTRAVYASVDIQDEQY